MYFNEKFYMVFAPFAPKTRRPAGEYANRLWGAFSLTGGAKETNMWQLCSVPSGRSMPGANYPPSPKIVFFRAKSC